MVGCNEASPGYIEPVFCHSRQVRKILVPHLIKECSIVLLCYLFDAVLVLNANISEETANADL